jgi:hypothetical protein
MAAAFFAAILGPTAAYAQSITPGLSATASADPAFVLSTDCATLAFGDGAIGQTPAAGAALAPTFASGGGAAGNVNAPAGALDFQSALCLVFGC